MADHPEYPAKITSEHAGKPKYSEMVKTVADAMANPGDAMRQVERSFDLDTAVGDQLDIIGLWAGVVRQVDTPIQNAYFTWGDTAHPLQTGWSYGVWKRQYDPSTGIEYLPDDAFRTIIRARIAGNHWDGSIPGAYQVWDQAFSISQAAITHSMLALSRFLTRIHANYDLDTAVGAQLDEIGQWVGVEREQHQALPSDYFFEWSDTASDGWGTGHWKALASPDYISVLLTDTQYRQAIHAALDAGVPNSTVLVVLDYQDMSMDVGVSNNALSGLGKSILVNGVLPIRPSGVRIRNYRISPTVAPLFSWGIDNSNLSGWHTGAWAEIY